MTAGDPLATRGPHPHVGMSGWQLTLRLVKTTLASAAVTVLAWFVFMGWHHEGDYNAWANIGLAFTLILVTAVPAWFGFVYGAAAGITAAFTATLMFSLDNSTQPETVTANMWPIGAGFLLFGALGGLGIVTVLVRMIVTARSAATQGV
jgi:hypothetical protein